MKFINLIILLLISVSLFAQTNKELYRIRVENSVNGLVQVSLDEGENYYSIGKVKSISTKCGVGFMASDYVYGGTVCAVASHAIRIKTYPYAKKTKEYKNVRLFSILPKEFWTIPKGFGGYFSNNSAICTDIHTGTGIFLNFAPFPETKAYIEEHGKLYDMEIGHIPYEGAIYVLPVFDNRENISYIDFDNFKNGYVTTSNNGTITNVYKKVSAVGRYDATTYNRPGQINTAHGGVITIDTSPLFPFSQKEGDKIETRGGFMIQPVYHALRQNDIKPQVMTVGSDETRFEQEGEAPLYANNISLWYYPKNLESSYYAELKVDDKYIKMPSITGKVDNGLTKEYLNKKLGIKCKTGVTGIRLHIPKFNKDLAKEYLLKLSEEYNIKNKTNICNNLFTYTHSKKETFEYFVDGKKLGVAKDKVEIDIKNYVKGLHHFQIITINNEKYNKYFYVDN